MICSLSALLNLKVRSSLSTLSNSSMCMSTLLNSSPYFFSCMSNRPHMFVLVFSANASAIVCLLSTASSFLIAALVSASTSEQCPNCRCTELNSFCVCFYSVSSASILTSTYHSSSDLNASLSNVGPYCPLPSWS